MEGIEKQIETSALRLSDLKPGFDRQEEEYYQSNKVKIYDLVKQVVKSDLAKQYWFSDFIDEIIENETFFDFASKCASKKYEIDSREHTIAIMSIKFGMGCSLTKQYWQKGMYNEEEVRRLLNQCNCLSKSIADFNEQEWFENNKKK